MRCDARRWPSELIYQLAGTFFLNPGFSALNVRIRYEHQGFPDNSRCTRNQNARRKAAVLGGVILGWTQSPRGRELAPLLSV
jgi:hypothetical protein